MSGNFAVVREMLPFVSAAVEGGFSINKDLITCCMKLLLATELHLMPFGIQEWNIDITCKTAATVTESNAAYNAYKAALEAKQRNQTAEQQKRLKLDELKSQAAEIVID